MPGARAVAAVYGGMLSVQGGTALGVLMLAAMTAPAVAWVRLALAAVVLLAWARPRLRGRSPADMAAVVALGAAVAVMSVCSTLAVSLIPFGTASAIEFLGPLTVAACGLRRPVHLLWPVAAAAGVLLLTRPWAGAVDLLGVLCALGAAAGWGAYIVLSQRVGDRYAGADGLALSTAVAAVLAAVPLCLSGDEALSVEPWILLLLVASTALTPICYQFLEMYALRRMRASAVALLNSQEPAIALVIGLVVLAQTPTVVQVCGIALVCLAGYGAIRGGGRVPEKRKDPADDRVLR